MRIFLVDVEEKFYVLAKDEDVLEKFIDESSEIKWFENEYDAGVIIEELPNGEVVFIYDHETGEDKDIWDIAKEYENYTEPVILASTIY